MIGELQLAAVLSLACLTALRFTRRLEFLQSELEGAGRRWLGLGLLFTILAIAVFFPVATVGDASDFDPADADFRTLFAGHVLLVAFLVSWWLLSGRPHWRVFLSLPARPLASAVSSGVATGVVGWAVTLLVTAIVASTVASISEQALAPRHPPPVMLWMAHLSYTRKAVIVGVAMTVEETFFRAFLQPRLGLFVSTLLFALAHFNYGLPLMVVAVFTISLVFGMLFELRRNLLPCIVAHGVFDAIQIFVIIPLAVQQLT